MTTTETTSTSFRHRIGSTVFSVWSSGGGAACVLVDGSDLAGREGAPLVEIFTAREQRARTSQAYVRSAVGSRLRVSSVESSGDMDGGEVTIRQEDRQTGLVASTGLRWSAGTDVVQIRTTVTNEGSEPVVVTAISSAALGLGRSESDVDQMSLAIAHSEWLAENRWKDISLREFLPALTLDIHQQDGRGHAGISSHGAWSSGEYLPCGVVTMRETGEAVAWQIETSAGWHVDLSQGLSGANLTLLGPTDSEHQFASRLEPGASFQTAPAALAYASGGRDGALAQMTRYRRTLLRQEASSPLPVVYNDFMNTLMGEPSTEKLRPLILAAADAGVEIFCIDAGWFADPALGDWWSTVGEWREAPSRFPGGLREVTDLITGLGMGVGMWLEPEIIGAKSPAAPTLPDEAFFMRWGARVVEHDRYHLDFRHPAAREHLDEVVDRLVREYGVSFLKLDYNINAGAGTELDAASAGEGLLAHTRAYQDWLAAIQDRHPHLLLENCSSGAMRADYALLRMTHLQSTSDQQDYLRYPPIAASAPASMIPEQCGNWAYPDASMSDEQTALTLVTGLSGRLYLSGFLPQLRESQIALVREAVRLHKTLRPRLSQVEPFWPLGLPGWSDDIICLGFRDSDGDTLFVWNRSEQSQKVVIPGSRGRAEQLFPRGVVRWPTAPDESSVHVDIPALGARVFQITPARTDAGAAD